MSPRPSMVPVDTDNCTSYQRSQQIDSTLNLNKNNNNNNNNNNTLSSNVGSAKKEPGKPPNRAGSCRVCLKSFKPEDYNKTCCDCQQRVCEDCASYSKLDENEDATMWRCSVCRRKMASRICIPQASTDSLLDVPVLEALQRRHSDAKLGTSTQNLAAPTEGGALAPPRSPELRRHSDVSPASLKELEKLKGGTTPGGDLDWRKGGRSMAPSRSSSPPRQDDLDATKFGPALSRIASRRGSRVTRQRSYDNDVKNEATSAFGVGSGVGVSGNGGGDAGLGIPAMTRRKSAYDVFAPIATQSSQQPSRSPGDGILPQHVLPPGSRRPSFRVPYPPEDVPQNDDSPSPDHESPVLTVDEDRRLRRRGSQLPDLAALRDRGALPPIIPAAVPPPLASFTGPNLEDLEAPRRQTSLDGEAIKIVIHDVDSGPICSSKRRIVLRRDPTDNAHRSIKFRRHVVADFDDRQSSVSESGSSDSNGF